MTQIVPFRLYTVPEAAELLGVSEQAVRTLIADDRLAVTRINESGHPRVTGQAILNFTAAETPA